MGDLSVCRWLLSRCGQQYSWRDRDSAGVSPVHLAARFGHTEVLQSFLDTDCCAASVPTVASSAPVAGGLRVARVAMSASAAHSGAPTGRGGGGCETSAACSLPAMRTREDATPLHFAAQAGQLPAIKMLLLHCPRYFSLDSFIPENIICWVYSHTFSLNFPSQVLFSF